MTVDSGATVLNLPVHTKTGYAFKGWGLTEGTEITTRGPFYEDTTLYAVYTAGMYNVYFEDIDQTVARQAGKELGVLPTTTKDGYTFDGWAYNGTKVSETSIMPAQNITLTAVWVAKNISSTDYVIINYYSEGVRINYQKLPVGEILDDPGSPAVSTVDSKHFMYWSASDGGERYEFGNTVSADLNLYAVWN
jgi:uncharacterized repeat protein (TIGR02543 family)